MAKPAKHKAKTSRRFTNEFTPQELRATLQLAGEHAAKSAHEKGRPTSFIRRVGGRVYLVNRFSDGSEIIKRLFIPTSVKG